MTKSPVPRKILPCGCQNCLCHRGPRCRCQAYNSMLDLVCWYPGRSLRRLLARC